MKKVTIAYVVMVFLLSTSCEKAPVGEGNPGLEEQLIGTWSMQGQLIDGGACDP